jgi:hypothetical protein
MTRGIKMLIVACNTASAVALGMLKKRLSIPVVGVIEPPAREAVRRTRAKRIGVIGTRATIASQAYTKAIRKLDPEVEVISMACPLFVPVVEEGLEADECVGGVDKYRPGSPDGIDVSSWAAPTTRSWSRAFGSFWGTASILSTRAGRRRERSRGCWESRLPCGARARAGAIFLSPTPRISFQTSAPASSGSPSAG